MKKTIFTTLLTVSFASVSFLTGYAQQVISKQDVVITANAVTSQKIIDAIQKPDLKAINKIINDDPDLLKQKLIEISDKEYQPTLLHLAAMEEKTDVLKFLLEKGADPNAKDSENKIPILVAAALNNTEAVLYLDVNGTKDEVLDSCVELPARLKNATDYQEKAEERAAEFELYKVRINNAKRKAQANLKNYFLNTIKKLDMDKFVTHKEFEHKITEILERGLSDGEIEKLDYDSCFIVLKGNKSVTQLFEGYQLYLKDVENKNNVDKIALDEMKKLTENFISKTKKEMSDAVSSQNKEALDAYLIDINQTQKTFAPFTTMRKTVAGLLIENPMVNDGQPEFLSEKYQVVFAKNVDKLIRHLQRQQNTFLLMVATQNGQLDIVEYLVERGADVNAKDTDMGNIPFLMAATSGKTPLMFAARNNYLEIVKYLIKNGADVNAKDNNSITPFKFAAGNNYLEITKYLIENGADVNVKNNDGKTPLDYAKSEEVKKILRDAG
ncbi:MAG: ankyrin repeat domain-containing protein, partial [Planctomycetaceae bacterium]|nr:ankyrin repeat domain-containing protein [Planctomycetaceae bacterium]